MPSYSGYSDELPVSMTGMAIIRAAALTSRVRVL